MKKKESIFKIKRNFAIDLCVNLGKMNIVDVAMIFGVSRQLIYNILKGKK